MAGSVKALELAYRITRRGGTTVTASLPHPDAHDGAARDATSSPRSAPSKAATSAAACRSRDIPRFIALYQQGLLPVDRLMSERIGLEDINAGFDRLADGGTVRQISVALNSRDGGRRGSRPPALTGSPSQAGQETSPSGPRWRGGRCGACCGPATCWSRCGRHCGDRPAAPIGRSLGLAAKATPYSGPHRSGGSGDRASRASRLRLRRRQPRRSRAAASISSMSRSSGWLKRDAVDVRRRSRARRAGRRGFVASGLSCTISVSRDRAFGGQRDEIGIGGKAAIPIGAPVDLDGVVDASAGRRRPAPPRPSSPPAEEPRRARRHVGRRDQQLDALEARAASRNRCATSAAGAADRNRAD